MDPFHERVMQQDELLNYEYRHGKLDSEDWCTSVGGGVTFGLLGCLLLSIFSGSSAAIPGGIVAGAMGFALVASNLAQRKRLLMEEKVSRLFQVIDDWKQGKIQKDAIQRDYEHIHVRLDRQTSWTMELETARKLGIHLEDKRN